MQRIANIGRRERQRRLAGGIVSLVIGAAVTVLLVATGAPPGWRVGTALPFLLAAFGYFQAREKT
jgi:hypothetical protein